jgi:hypothetical protein
MKCPPSRLASVCSGPLECEQALRLCGLEILVARKPSWSGMDESIIQVVSAVLLSVHRNAACAATVPCFAVGGLSSSWR